MSQYHGDDDGMDEALGTVTQVAMTVAARVGERRARDMERRARLAQASSEQEAAETAQRSRAEQAAARAALAPVHQDGWWEGATVREITKAYETAKAWRDVDPAAVRAEERITEQVRRRYGVDVAEDSDPAAVAEAIEHKERARARADDDRSDATEKTGKAVGLVADADVLDRRVREETDRMHQALARGRLQEAGRHGAQADHAQDQAQGKRDQAGHLYDSAERRQATAKSLDHVENRTAVQARMTADVAQARPATDAVTHQPRQAPSPRPNRQAPALTRQTQRGMTGR
ncbi:hypothetical protein [Arsenicicoccus dermatophilus]|uniref:hypothetical protein n=1 Tax=Arsenicicoccus dermatophilus TaxID=1076331 RepID=UPI001F4D1BE7|nr:hypothetical protein [Arsenicicoccus dermatophilus]MCH8614405.1 hypothetical protein [Arsenicicoccus dermatophilus]